MKAKGWIIVVIIIVLLVAGVFVYWRHNIGNRQLMDMSYHFDRAIVRLPNGEIVEGKLTSWLDFSDSDVIQLKIDGKTYLTSYTNVCLIDD